MVIGSAAYFGNHLVNTGFQRDSKEYREDVVKLNGIKKKLLDFAVMQPEFYQSDLVSGSVVNKTTDKVPAPGYFPCPDLDGDGALNSGGESSCGSARDVGDDSTGFDYGFLPYQITSRNFYIPEASPVNANNPEPYYYYVVADRFVHSNPAYNNPATSRYAPLNPTLAPAVAPDSPPPAGLADGTLPWLSLDGQSGYVVLIIASGRPKAFPDGTIQDRTTAGDAKAVVGHYLDMRFDEDGNKIDNGNAAGDRFFYSNANENISINDVVVGITFDEWEEAIRHRIEKQQAALCAIDVNEPHWFNEYDAVNNPVGTGWRLEMGC